MNNTLTITLLACILFITGCAGNAIKSKSISVSAPVLLNGNLKSVNIQLDRSHNITPTTYVCSAWSYQVDTSSIGESIEKSLNASFINKKDGPEYEIRVDIEQDLELTLNKGFWSAIAEGEAEINARVSVRRNGKHLYRRTYNVNSDENMGTSCSKASTALAKAIQQSTKKLVTQIVEDLEREAAR